LRDTVALEIGISEVVLTSSKTLVRCCAEPFRGLIVVDRGTAAYKVQGAEILLCRGVTVMGSSVAPLKCKRRVLRNTLTEVIQSAKVVFGGGVALKSGSAIIFGGSGEVAWQTFAVFVEIAEQELGVRYVLRGGRAKPGERQIVVRRGRICGDKEFAELKPSRAIAGFGSNFEFGDGRDRAGRLLRAGGGEGVTLG